jgi:hypothetical protein
MIGLVLGHVGDIGEPVSAGIPLERVSTTTNPCRRGIPMTMVAVPSDRAEDAVREFKSFTEDRMTIDGAHLAPQGATPPGQDFALLKRSISVIECVGEGAKP